MVAPLATAAGPLGVDVGFALVAGDTGVGAVVDDVEVLRAGGSCGVAEREVEELAEVDEVGGVDVGLADDRYGLAGAVDWGGGVPEGKDVVDGGEVVGSDSVGGSAVVDSERRVGLGLGGLGLGGLGLGGQRRGSVGDGIVAEVADAVAGGAAGEVVERRDASDNWREGGGDGGVVGVGEVLAALDGVTVHAGAEGGLDHAGRAAEFDEGAGGVDLNVREVVVCEPGGDGGEVAVGGAEGCSEGLGSKPLVPDGGGLVLLPVDELLEGGLLFGTALEDEDDSAERGGGGEGALVELRAGEGVGVAGEGGEAGFVDGLKDAGAGGGKQ